MHAAMSAAWVQRQQGARRVAAQGGACSRRAAAWQLGFARSLCSSGLHMAEGSGFLKTCSVRQLFVIGVIMAVSDASGGVGSTALWKRAQMLGFAAFAKGLESCERAAVVALLDAVRRARGARRRRRRRLKHRYHWQRRRAPRQALPAASRSTPAGYNRPHRRRLCSLPGGAAPRAQRQARRGACLCRRWWPSGGAAPRAQRQAPRPQARRRRLGLGRVGEGGCLNLMLRRERERTEHTVCADLPSCDALCAGCTGTLQ